MVLRGLSCDVWPCALQSPIAVLHSSRESRNQPSGSKLNHYMPAASLSAVSSHHVVAHGCPICTSSSSSTGSSAVEVNYVRH
jgi:hypothetical protein